MMLMKFFGIFSLDMERLMVSLDTELKAALMSNESIQSSCWFSFAVLYIEFRIWMGWKVP